MMASRKASYLVHHIGRRRTREHVDAVGNNALISKKCRLGVRGNPSGGMRSAPVKNTTTSSRLH